MRKRRDAKKKTTDEKICPRCKVKKKSCLFGKDSHRVDGLSFLCIDCKRESSYDGRVKREYGISRERLCEMKNERNSVCDCCKTKTKLVIDHCHKSGTVRGMLCDKCNMALGLVGDSVETLKRMINYVKGE